MSTYDDVIGFEERTRSEILKGSYAKNPRDLGSALEELKKKYDEITGYEDKVKEAVAQTTGAEKAKSLQQSYDSLKALCEKKLHCLGTVSQISSLENNVLVLSQELDLRATMLTHPGGQPLEKTEKSELNLQGFISQSAQDCIFGVHDNWNWISSLVKCVGVHLLNGAAYHEFFHEVEESESWMLDDLVQISTYFETKVVNAGEEETKKLAAELERIFLTLCQWEAKTCRLWETATRLVPVPLRTSANREPLPARIICDYESKEITVRKNEDVVLLDNSKPKLWKIKNGKGQEGEVPAPVVLLPGPDAEAIKAALRLRLQLLTYWTNALKVIGKRLIYFMLIVFKSDYTSEEVSALRAMEGMEKESLLSVLTYIEDTFKRYWADHEGFLSVQERILVLKMILQDQGHEAVSNEELYRHLVILITTLHQATKVYQSTSDEWEKFKAVLEASRSPHLMLILDKWEQLQFVSKDYFSKFWKSALALDAKDKSLEDLKRFTLNGVEFEDLVDIGGGGSGMVEGGYDETTRPNVTDDLVEEVEQETVTQTHTQTLEYEHRTAEVETTGSSGSGRSLLHDDDGTGHGVAKERKTAETEQLSSAEMEEKKTFHIKSVVNPVDQKEMSLQDAILSGVIRPDDGVYVNTVTGEKIPIQVAMGNGLIKVMFSNTKRTEEKTSSIGIITVKTIREDTRPYIILWVRDTETGEELTPDEAAKRGILKEAQGFYVDRKTGKRSLITEAADDQLINIEYFGEKPETEVVSITYAVRAVVDRKQKKTVTFNEAVRRGIIERETGAYVDTLTGERIYVGDAIVRGFLKARIVDDPSSLNIDPQNTILIDKTKKIRDKVLNPLKIISAFKMAANK